VSPAEVAETPELDFSPVAAGSVMKVCGLLIASAPSDLAGLCIGAKQEQ